MTFHRSISVRFRGGRLLLSADGREYTFDLSSISPKLANAGKRERESFVISPSGYGIHWPLLDEDLSIEALIASPTEKGASDGRH